MTLETLSHVLEVECGWIQMISTENSKLELVAYHGFQFREQLANVILDIKEIYQKEILGLGNNLIITNLKHNSQYHISSLSRMGYNWLIAVPMRNHRLAGVMSITSRQKRKVDNDFANLITVVAGLATMVYEKTSDTLKELDQPEISTQFEDNDPFEEVDAENLFDLNSDLDRHTTDSSIRETDLLDAIYSGVKANQIAERFNSDIETVRNDMESIRNQLIKNFQSRQYTETVKQDNIHAKPLDQKSPSSLYVTREEFNEFKESLKTFFTNTLASLDDL
jgi:hypothetical protein